ncbi:MULTISPECIES: hypothetical protein [Corynebacterium]|uniref:hypothetical protein n=1 Tax=Corynebacterium TaxID=1716 RepID=UPI00124C42EB|nr:MULTISPECIES: hypothetical protein [Corynebacterium]
MTLHTHLITPLLRPTALVRRDRLDSAHFATSAPLVNLCTTLAATLCHDGTPLTQRDIDSLQISVSRAWGMAATNLVNAARSPRGLRFLTRRCGEITQIRTPGHSPTAWLAHPTTFTILNNHCSNLLGSNVVFVALSDDHLFAVPVRAAAGFSNDWITELARIHLPQRPGKPPQPLSPHALLYQDGFPHELSPQNIPSTLASSPAAARRRRTIPLMGSEAS